MLPKNIIPPPILRKVPWDGSAASHKFLNEPCLASLHLFPFLTADQTLIVGGGVRSGKWGGDVSCDVRSRTSESKRAARLCALLMHSPVDDDQSPTKDCFGLLFYPPELARLKTSIDILLSLLPRQKP